MRPTPARAREDRLLDAIEALRSEIQLVRSEVATLHEDVTRARAEASSASPVGTLPSLTDEGLEIPVAADAPPDEVEPNVPLPEQPVAEEDNVPGPTETLVPTEVLSSAAEAGAEPETRFEPNLPSPEADVESQAEAVMGAIVDQIVPSGEFDASQFAADFDLAVANPEPVVWSADEAPDPEPEPDEPIDPELESQLIQQIHEKFPDLAAEIDRFNADADPIPTEPGATAATITDEEMAALTEGMAFLSEPEQPTMDAGPEAEADTPVGMPDPHSEPEPVQADVDDGRQALSAAEIALLIAQASPDPAPEAQTEVPAAVPDDPTPPAKASSVVSADEIEKMLGLRNDPVVPAGPTPQELAAAEAAAAATEPADQPETVQALAEPETESDGGAEPVTDLLPSFEALDRVPGRVAAAALVLPLAVEGDTLVCAAASPIDPAALDEVAQASGLTVEPREAEIGAVVAAIRHWYVGEIDSRRAVTETRDPLAAVKALVRRKAA